MKKLVGGKALDQGSIYIGSEGVMYSPYVATPVLLPVEKFKGYKLPQPGGHDHYRQFVEACRGNGKTSTPFSYSGPLTESVLLGCLATRFPTLTLEWDAAGLKVTNSTNANAFVRRTPARAGRWTVCSGTVAASDPLDLDRLVLAALRTEEMGAWCHTGWEPS